MLAPSKYNINLWKMMISFIIIISELLNGNWHGLNRGYDGFVNNIIKMSRTKSSDITEFSRPSFGNLNQGCLDTWLLNMTISEHTVCLSQHAIDGIAQFLTELHEKHEQHWNYQQTRKLTYQYHWKVCAHPHLFHFHLCEDGRYIKLYSP